MMLIGILAAQRTSAAAVNILQEGDFADGQGNWVSFSRAVGSTPTEAASTGRVTYNNNAAQLYRAGLSSFSYGVIQHATTDAIVPGGRYRLRFDYAGPTVPLEAYADVGSSTTRINITSQMTTASGSVDVVLTAAAGASAALFRLGVCPSANNAANATTVDNIRLETLT